MRDAVVAVIAVLWGTVADLTGGFGQVPGRSALAWWLAFGVVTISATTAYAPNTEKKRHRGHSPPRFRSQSVLITCEASSGNAPPTCGAPRLMTSSAAAGGVGPAIRRSGNATGRSIAVSRPETAGRAPAWPTGMEEGACGLSWEQSQMPR